VHTKKYERFGLTQYLPILVIVFGPIAKGFLEEMGRDIWRTLSKRLASTVSNRNGPSEVEFHYSYESNEVELKVTSADGNVIASAFDQIQNTLEIVERSKQKNIYFEFDPSTNKWKEQTIDEQKIAGRFEGMMAKVGSVTVRGHTYKVTEEELKQVATEAAGMPIKYEHTGPPIGKVEDAWYEDGKLMVRFVVFEPHDEKGRQILESFKSGKVKGLSLGFSFDSKNK
jgi:hypothetical protein